MASRTISNVASELLPRNASRKSWLVQNEDSTITLYIMRERAENTTVSTTVHDFAIAPGASLGLNSLLDGLSSIQDRWTIIAASGSPRIAVFETEDVIR